MATVRMDNRGVSLPWRLPWRREATLSPIDGTLFMVPLALTLMGLVMVFSASAVVAGNRFHDPMYFLKREVAWLFVGLVLLMVVSRIDYMVWKRWALPLLGVTLALLTVVLIPALGLSAKGARRWLRVAGFTMQPAELAKLVLVIYLARYAAKKESRLNDFKTGFLPPLLVVGVVGGFILLEPDMGTVVVMGLVTLTVLFLAGARPRHIAGLAFVSLPAAAALILTSPYRRQRLLTFLNPWDDPQGAGFQVTQSFLAFGSGGPFGLGLGEGRQKLFFLPEAHTDFVLALVGEELGLIGTSVIIVLFAVLVLKGFHVASRARDPFGRYLGYGITSLFGFQALINACVVSGLVPTKGLTLPFVSYGGSSLLVCLIAVGMLLSISRDRQGGVAIQSTGTTRGKNVARR